MENNKSAAADITAGNSYTGAELIAYTSRHTSVVLFCENCSSGVGMDDRSQYDVIAIEHGFIQMQGGMNRMGELVTIRLQY